MDSSFDFFPDLAGSLLIAHPGLHDPQFKKSVVLLSAYNPGAGGLGVVINRPLHLTLEEYSNSFSHSPLAQVPIYEGGPVGSDQIILTAWQWFNEEKVFKLYFGIPEAKAVKLLKSDPSIEIRAFLGYSGWTDGQLEFELQHHNWFLSSISGLHVPCDEKHPLWREIIGQIHPELLFLADAPENPSVN
ncbi:MAG: hypothetical protein COZ46_07525 [Verrucomicrobia bacterium CG_4_10_14_3_um_filter_43_23]|nr:MAG: hypothetical protein AUJ82_03170 [Verrucomicrobia bacterium CG1_02_43_26]PIP59696.1 MAG: hypothetical protein COX01_02000 [Verrucomicrobia bacterium CG22_combo_CG10-13_8_21_14_all_43_17]PIX57708.1 MAG: hypothetical protein COZ46_07525 [Verrucomicrobia bacterium CG_4_10_14_3_um_filter_43_23]PIY62500.1 MAG: hypothetical protein COY94_01710 [Verrucomicrobia bacterium CG_4_10_14_0_8_um_filter_43_34]PJA44680.1 MAG: hypothetical protein CO175_01915 [Verrucomicrobia bacterium CG_4_9_14_3_um_fi